MPASKKPVKPPEDPRDALRRTLSVLGFQSLVHFATETANMDVRVISTGFPQLDLILHPKLKGLPCGRDIEIISPKESAGKTSLCLNFIAAAQAQGGETLFGDVEQTLTNEYAIAQGVDIGKLLYMRDSAQGGPIPAETYFEVLRKLSPVIDLAVIDSVAALDLESNISKASMDDEDRMGGVSLLLSQFLKKNTAKRASICWINQTRSRIGGFSPHGGTPTGGTGGRALPFYSSVRLELTEIAKIPGPGGKEGPPAGIQVKVYTKKNKIWSPYRQCVLTYLFGIGFSRHWDYMTVGLSMKLIEASGSWLSFEGERLGQGKGQAHAFLRQPGNPIFEKLKTLVDQEGTMTKLTADGPEPTKDEIEEQEAADGEAA
jgi:recombination protein RecA